jgi:hypothetical protein
MLYSQPNDFTTSKVFSHGRRLLSVDLRFPVILSADGCVMDGSHCIVAASVKGIETVDRHSDTVEKMLPLTHWFG